MTETTTPETPSDPLQALADLAARIAARAEQGWNDSDRAAAQAELAELAAALEIN
jgi:hypothetical protein